MEREYFYIWDIYCLWGVGLEQRVSNKKIILCTYGMLVAGTIIGCILFFCCLLLWDYPVLDYGLEDFHILPTMNISSGTYVSYICERRVLQALLFIAIWAVSTYYIAAVGLYMFCGCYFGFILADFFVKFGGEGIAYVLACFIPHYILLLFAIYLTGCWFAENQMKEQYFYRNVNYVQYFIKIFVIFLLFAGALWIEIKFQKNILNYFYQYLV